MSYPPSPGSASTPPMVMSTLPSEPTATVAAAGENASSGVAAKAREGELTSISSAIIGAASTNRRALILAV